MITGSARSELQERRRPWRWASRASWLVGLLAVLALLVLVVAPVSLVEFGYRTRVIRGGSMEPTVHRGSLVIGRLVDPKTVAPGDIITFRSPEARVRVTHRVIAIREENGQLFFTVRGDANASPDAGEVSFAAKVEKVQLVVPYAGYLAGFGRTALGIFLLIVLPALALAVLHVQDRWKRGSAQG